MKRLIKYISILIVIGLVITLLFFSRLKTNAFNEVWKIYGIICGTLTIKGVYIYNPRYVIYITVEFM